MSPDKPAETPSVDISADRKLIRIRGVRSTPGGWVWMNELVDGWATFPDRSAGGRRLQWGIGILILMLIPVDVVVSRLGLDGYGAGASVAILALLLLLAVVGNLTTDRQQFSRWRARNQSMLRAGGKQAFRAAMRTHGPARTVGAMNILLGSVGRTDPVFSRRRIARSSVDHRWWRTTVRLTLTGNHVLTYRVYGLRSPGKLARVFDAQAQHS
jgi:hypothetical protein